MLETLAADVRFGVRQLRKSPVFTLVAACIIALGTGAVTTIFSVANGIALRPLPGATRPDRLVEITRVRPDRRGSDVSASYDYYRHLRDGQRALRGVAAWSMLQLTVGGGAGAGTTSFGNLVSGNFFDVLGARPALGRFFAPDEDRVPNARPVVVLSHAFWAERFGADSAVVGRTIALNGHPFTVVGVAPRGFRGVYAAIKTDVWVPLMMQPQLREGRLLEGAGSAWLQVVGRLRDGATAAEAGRELSALTARYPDRGEPADFRRFTAAHVAALGPLPGDASGAVLAFLALLLAASGLVLLIACVNVAGMLLARATARRREVVLRAALGASRARVVRQLLVDSLLLFLFGACGGVALAAWGTRLLAGVTLPVEVPLAVDVAPDARVLAFTLIAALFTGVVFGLVPALHGTRADLAGALRGGTPGGGAHRSRARDALVVGQLAMSLLLLVASGLFLRALDRGRRVDPGFTTAGVVTAAFDTRTYGYDAARSRAFYAALKARLAAYPGVSAVSYTRLLPLTGSTMGSEFQVDGAAAASDAGRGETVPITLTEVDPDYFAVVRIPLVRGRAFGDGDRAGTPRVAIVNETLARRYWPGEDAVGRTLRRDGAPVTVVGVARDAKFGSLGERPQPFLYLSTAQTESRALTLVVRSAGELAPLSAAVREAVRAYDATLPVPVVTSLASAASASP